MSLKKRYLFLILLVCLFAISAVSAAEISNETNMIANDDSSLITESVNEDILTDSYGTFQELQDEINAVGDGGTLNLTKNYKYVDGSNTGIEINKSITIDGKGHTLDGNLISRIFYVNAEEVTLKNMIFINGFTKDDNGGAIYWDGTKGTLTNCSFLDCSADWGCGGAIYWNGNVLSDCSFVNCSAGIDGGAVYLVAENGVLSDCSFIDCPDSAVSWRDDNGVLVNCSFVNGGVSWAGADGVLANCSFVNGGVSWYYGAGVLANCSFVNGAVSWSGADGVLANCSFVNSVVYWRGYGGTLSDCNFMNRSAGDGGGAVSWSGADGVLSDCSFVNCSAFYTPIRDSGCGGAVSWAADNGVLANCSFVNCSAKMYGGAVYWHYDTDNCVLANCSFVNCSAEKYGGAVYSPHDADNGALLNCSFVNCSDSGEGGAVHWKGADCVLAKCSFINCSATRYLGGGAVWWDSNGNLSDCSFVNCSAKSFGGAVWANNANGVLANCSFVNCSADDNEGGAVFWYYGADGVLANCSFVNCSAIDNGGAVSWWGDNGVLANCSFVDCSALNSKRYSDKCGGAVFWRGYDGVLSGCSFVNCSAEDYGGAVYWSGGNGVLSGCSFVNSSVDYGGYGGGIYFTGTNCFLIDPYFEGNIASKGIDWYSIESLNVTGVKSLSTILHAPNMSIIQGYSKDLTVTLSDSYDNFLAGEQVSITFNNVEYDLTTDSKGKVSISIPNNLDMGRYVATISYGGHGICSPSRSNVIVYVRSKESDATFSDLVREILNEDNQLNLTENYSYDEEMDYNYRSGIIIEKSIIINANGHTINGNNQARIFNILEDNVVLSNINFINSAVVGDGGAIYWDGTNGVLSDCSFVNCSATGHPGGRGGAVHWHYGANNGVLSDCSFVNCSADDEGGAVIWDGDNGTLSDCSFVNCSTSTDSGTATIHEGGAVYWSSNNGVLSDCSFVDCSALYLGGAIFWAPDNGVLANCSFVDCLSSHYGGGAIYWTGNTNVLANCSFINCRAEDRTVGVGGAVNWYYGIDNVLANCSFVDCVNAIHKYLGDNGTLSDCSFANCGIAVYWSGNNGTLSDCSFVNCSGNYFGGAVMWDGDNAVLSDCIFVDCSGGNLGGAVYWENDYGSVNHSVFVNCSSGEYGGGIYFTGTNCILIDPYFEGNTATYGPDWYSVNPLIIVNETKIITALTASDVVTSYKSDANVVATLKDVNGDAIRGTEVKIIFNEVTETLTTDNNGQVSFSTYGLNPNIYTAIIVFIGDDIYATSFTTAKVTIIKSGTTTLESNDIVTTYNGGEDLVATLKDADGIVIGGAKVRIVLGNVDKTLTTDSNGQVSLSTDGLVPDTYTADITFKGDDTYNPSSTTAKVTINKLDTILKAEYDANSKNIVAVVKDANDNPVSGVNVGFDIGGMKYVDTDATGTANYYVGELAKKAYSVDVKAYANNIYKDSNKETVKFDLSKISTTLTASDVVTEYNSGKNFTATLKDDGGKAIKGAMVTVKVGSVTKVLYTDSNGQVSLTTDGLLPDTYTATATFDGDDKYNGASTSVVIVVNPKAKENATISIDSPAEVTEGDSVTVTVTLPKDATGTVTIDDKVVPVKNGVASAVLTNLPVGNTTVPVTYSGDDKYNGASTSVVIVVNPKAKENATISIDSPAEVTEGDSVTVTVTLPKDATGTVTIDDKVVPVKNGVASAVLTNLPVGNTTVPVTYSGDDKYNSIETSVIVTVKEDTSYIISAPDVTKYYQGPERFVVTVKDKNNQPIPNADIKIYINGQTYTRTTDNNGVASMAINLDSGKYDATVEYDGMKSYSTVTVNPTIVAKDFTKIFRNNTQYYGKFTDSQGNLLKNTDVEFNINGVFYTRTTNDQGVARMNINLNPGSYILTATNPINGEMQSVRITVLSSIVENYDLTKYYKNDSQYRVRLLDGHGNPVGAGVSIEFNINGVFYTRTSDANGYVKMNINLNPGTYIITANYNGLMASNTIKVLPILVAGDLVMSYKDGSKFEVTLLDGQGKAYANKDITFNINGVFYTRTTDANGIARLNINLMAGEYIITSMYENGAATSNKVTIRS